MSRKCVPHDGTGAEWFLTCLSLLISSSFRKIIFLSIRYFLFNSATGYLFDKGIYTADCVTKSANYCVGNSAREACILLCEVALGEMNELVHADYNASNLPDGKLSTKGLGRTIPNEKQAIYVSEEELDGTAPAAKSKKPKKGDSNSNIPKVKIPMGLSVDAPQKDLYLQYNEYIVYSVEQVRLRYLIRFKFA